MKSEGHLVDGFASSAQHNITILPSAGLFLLCGFQGAITGEGNAREHPLKPGKSLGEPSTEGCISK